MSIIENLLPPHIKVLAWMPMITAILSIMCLVLAIMSFSEGVYSFGLASSFGFTTFGLVSLIAYMVRKKIYQATELAKTHGSKLVKATINKGNEYVKGQK